MPTKINVIDCLVGIIVLALFGMGAGYVGNAWYAKYVDTVAVKAEFDHVGALSIGSAVKINGVQVGEVTTITLNPKKNFTAIVTCAVHKEHGQLSDDTEASITSEGFLGPCIVVLTPGQSDVPLADNTIYRTTAAPMLNLTDLIEKFMQSSKTSVGDDKSAEIMDRHDNCMDDALGAEKKDKIGLLMPWPSQTSNPHNTWGNPITTGGTI